MRFIILFVWAFLLTHMAGYLIASMNGAAYEPAATSIIAVIAVALLIIIGEILPVTKETEQH